MNNERQTTTSERRTATGDGRIHVTRANFKPAEPQPAQGTPNVRSLALYPLHTLWLNRWSVVIVLAALLAACSSSTPSQTVVQGSQGGGSVSPEAVTQSFFDDLRDALKDPQLTNDKQRGVWAEQLANYFAPNERDDQRIALSASLDNFVGGLDKLDANESLTLDLQIVSLQKIDETSDRAMVQVNGAIHVQITRTTNTSIQNLYDDTVSLDKIIGGANGAVPVIRIGRSWYLTEG